MSRNTPINEYRIKSKDAIEFIKKAKGMRLFSVNKISVPNDIFNELVESITPSLRIDYKDQIPFHGKTLVRL